MKEKNAILIFKGILEGLLEMSKKKYVHRDLKLENIMFDKKENFSIKLVDFGFTE